MGRHSRPDDAPATPIQGQWSGPRDGEAVGDRAPDNGAQPNGVAARESTQAQATGDTNGRRADRMDANGRGAIPTPARAPEGQTAPRAGPPSPPAPPAPTAAPSTPTRKPTWSPPTDASARATSSPPTSSPPHTPASSAASTPASTSGTLPAAPIAQTAPRGKPPLSDRTQVIPRVPAAVTVPTAVAVPTATAAPPATSAPETTALATPYPAISALYPTGTAAVAPDPNPTTVFPRPRFDDAVTALHPGGAVDRAPEDDPDDDLAATGAPQRHHRLFWVGLTVFWALGLGAGLITLTSLGARASCTGSDKSLDCGNTGSAIALVLTLCVIVLVGVVTVHAVEVRDRAKSWGRDLGLGLVVLLLLSFAAWRLILTING